MHTITANTSGGASTSPLAVEGYESTRSSRNIIHDVLDGGIGVSYVTPRPRSGTLNLVYVSEADAIAAELLHTQETSFTYVSSDFDSIGMTYVLDGRLTRELDTAGFWRVGVGFQELS